MLWTPQKGKIRVEHNVGSTGTTTYGTAVVTGATSTTKGSAAQMIASTAFDAYWVTILAVDYSQPASASEGCLDILIGAATEEVLIADLLMGHCAKDSEYHPPKRWDFPLHIPAGSRISARGAGVRTSVTFYVAIFLYGGCGVPGYRVGGKVTTYGVTVPTGTTIVPGASGAEGSWTQIAASTSEDHFALVPSFQPETDGTLTGSVIACDIGIGAAAAEEMIAEGFMFAVENRESCFGPWPSLPAFQDIPSGTRLAMRASNSGTNDLQYGVALHAVS